MSSSYSITDVRSFASVQSWLGELQDINDEAIVVLVGNKADMTKDRKGENLGKKLLTRN
ncbi:hypothetical protein M1146_04830 [Patescibacteria group bacterium]|nr:hypothetical protein [Patescibacteria group bacterium]